MTTEIVPFAFAGGEVRVVVIDGEPWWVARDVAEALGYSATSAMTRSLDEDERGVRTLHTPSGDQDMVIVSESGIYSAILRSTRAEAAAFKRWITHEVLPSIRKTGTFTVPQTREQLLAQAVIAANEAIAEASTRITELTPRAEAWDELASADGDYEIADAAKILARAGVNTGQRRLFGQLAEMRWIHRGAEGKWKAYQTAVDAGYLAEKPQSHHHPRTGEVILDAPQVRVTVKGLDRLRQRLHVGSLRAVNTGSSVKDAVARAEARLS